MPTGVEKCNQTAYFTISQSEADWQNLLVWCYQLQRYRYTKLRVLMVIPAETLSMKVQETRGHNRSL